MVIKGPPRWLVLSTSFSVMMMVALEWFGLHPHPGAIFAGTVAGSLFALRMS